MKPTILVSGATGKVGTEVTKQLLEQGHPVRAMVRQRDVRSERLRQLGAEVADLFDVEQVIDAMWLSSPSHPALLTRHHWLTDHLLAMIPDMAYTIVNPGLFGEVVAELIPDAAVLGSFPRRDDLKPGRATNEAVVLMNENARQLRGTSLPMLLHAKPGAILNEGAIAYARRNYPYLTLGYVGRGKHFLPEDQPQTMARLINEWLVRVVKAAPVTNQEPAGSSTTTNRLPQ